MWLKVPTSDKQVRKFYVDEVKDQQSPVRIVTNLGVEIRLDYKEADDLSKQLNYLLMDRQYREIEK